MGNPLPLQLPDRQPQKQCDLTEQFRIVERWILDNTEYAAACYLDWQKYSLANRLGCYDAADQYRASCASQARSVI